MHCIHVTNYHSVPYKMSIKKFKKKQKPNEINKADIIRDTQT